MGDEENELDTVPYKYGRNLVRACIPATSHKARNSSAQL